VLLAFASAALAQNAPSTRILGELTAINAGSNQLTIKTDKGESVSLTLAERTRYLRVTPGETDLKNASKISLSDLGTGDRVLALGKPSEDGKTLAATSVIVMTKADITKKQEHDRAEWQTRGITGLVTAVAPDTRQLTVTVHTLQGAKTITVESDDTVDFRSYAPDSVRFNDTKPSSFAELKPGNHVRVLGEKNADGSRMKAEAIVFGSFRSLAATVVSVNPAANEVTVTDLGTKKNVIVRVNSDTTMRRLPPPMAMSLARRYNPSYFRTSAAGGRGARGGQGAGGGAEAGGGDGGMRFSGSQAADLQQALEKVAPLPITELNKGDAILVTSTAGADPSRVTAISLVAGVEPLLTKAAGERINLDWTLDMNMPQ
jgi:hypothetical protein